MQIRPPDVAAEWDGNTPWMQAMLLAYSQVRDCEEEQNKVQLAQISGGAKVT